MQTSQAIEEMKVSGPGRLVYLNAHRSKDCFDRGADFCENQMTGNSIVEAGIA
jgi:hypothetical protein